MVKIVAVVLVLFGLNGVKFSQGCEIWVNQINQEEKDSIVNKHNDLRKLIANGQVEGQPRGVNLKRMYYDDSLATTAQHIAETCNFAHVPVNDGRWPAVGQNLYMWMSTGRDNGTADWNSAIQAWFNEYQQYTYNPDSKGAGHYTQVVWADTYAVGCGYTYFNGGGTFPYHKLYVCNYGPAGNYVGEYPYQTGESGCEDLC